MQLEELWSANDTKTQQSTLQLTVFVAALMGEGVDGIGAKARWLNWLCGFRVRRSAGGGRKPHGEGGDWDGGRFFFLRALYTPKRPEAQKTDVFGRRTGRKKRRFRSRFFRFCSKFNLQWTAPKSVFVSSFLVDKISKLKS